MGTWSAAIFADDVACDVRDQYLALIAEGLDGAEASHRLESEWGDVDSDPDEGPVFWIALAAVQWEYGRLEPHVAKRALAIIDGGVDLQRWEGGSSAARRRSVLQTLRRKLMSPQPKPKRPRVRKLAPPRSISVEAPDGRAGASVWDVGDTGDTDHPMAQVIVDMESRGTRGGGGVFTVLCRWDRVGLRWIDADTLEITYPAKAEVEDRDEESFFYGRTIKLVYRPQDGDST
jgi:hypothetical protein